MTTQNPSIYDESSIQILKGLEPVKQRPGMYTRTDSPLHIIQEALDNAVDEALGGYASLIEVTFNPDGSISVEDNGRGIPVGLHPDEKIPVIEAVFTVLHSGGKFKKTAKGAYAYSGGLHGVGVSVTNALSELLRAEVKRDGHLYSIEFSNGDVVKPLKKEGRVGAETGTKITARPNPKYFDSPEVPFSALRSILKAKAVLLPGLSTRLVDARQEGEPVIEDFHFENGLSAYLSELADGAAPIGKIIASEQYVENSDGPHSEGEGASWAFAWYDGTSAGTGESFVNLIPTPQGGTHVAGLKQALFNAVKSFIDFHSMLPKGLKLTADDIFRNVHYVLSARMLDPSFEGQTKDKLISRTGLRLLEATITPSLEAWLNTNPNEAKSIAELALFNANSRQRAATKVERRRSSSVVVLPGKLADCESSNAQDTELFLVEGDSAGGSAKMGRNKETQAILPLRGKGLNTWEKTKIEALGNAEVRDMATAFGVDPHGVGDAVDFSKLRYGKICILSDADVDGFHIQTLLLTMFLKHFPQLVERGHVYVSKPPLYRIDIESAGKKRPAKKMYAMSPAELNQTLERATKDGYSKWRVGRFKGLGEMNPLDLWETTLCPDTRLLLQVTIPEGAHEEVNATFENLMHKSRADWRKSWMERRGNEISET